MVQKRLLLALIALATCGLLGVPAIAPVDAQGLADRRPRDDNAIEPGGYSLDDAVELAQSRYRAKAVKAETVEEQGRRVPHAAGCPGDNRRPAAQSLSHDPEVYPGAGRIRVWRSRGAAGLAPRAARRWCPGAPSRGNMRGALRIGPRPLM